MIFIAIHSECLTEVVFRRPCLYFFSNIYAWNTSGYDFSACHHLTSSIKIPVLRQNVGLHHYFHLYTTLLWFFFSLKDGNCNVLGSRKTHKKPLIGKKHKNTNRNTKITSVPFLDILEDPTHFQPKLTESAIPLP